MMMKTCSFFLIDSGMIAEGEDLAARCAAAARRGGRAGELGAHVPPGEIAPVRILQTWLASHPDTATLTLEPMPVARAIAEFADAARAGAGASAERELGDDRGDALIADLHV